MKKWIFIDRTKRFYVSEIFFGGYKARHTIERIYIEYGGRMKCSNAYVIDENDSLHEMQINRIKKDFPDFEMVQYNTCTCEPIF